MNDFEYECMQRKRLASQAKYRKRGNKSKKCSLPSDGMTQKQWKERCGPILSYNLSNVIAWSDFKHLPTSVQTEYITKLQNQYGITAVDLAKMFGVTPLTVRKHVEAKGLDVSFPRGRTMNKNEKDMWALFLTGGTKQTDGAASNLEEESVTEAAMGETTADACQEQERLNEDHKDVSMNMSGFTIRFDGAINVDMIANSLKMILGDRSGGSVEITYRIA